jgi:hypothetical protein
VRWLWRLIDSYNPDVSKPVVGVVVCVLLALVALALWVPVIPVAPGGQPMLLSNYAAHLNRQATAPEQRATLEAELARLEPREREGTANEEEKVALHHLRDALRSFSAYRAPPPPSYLDRWAGLTYRPLWTVRSADPSLGGIGVAWAVVFGELALILLLGGGLLTFVARRERRRKAAG